MRRRRAATPVHRPTRTATARPTSATTTVTATACPMRSRSVRIPRTRPIRTATASPDFRDTDSDGDGIADALEAGADATNRDRLGRRRHVRLPGARLGRRRDPGRARRVGADPAAADRHRRRRHVRTSRETWTRTPTASATDARGRCGPGRPDRHGRRRHPGFPLETDSDADGIDDTLRSRAARRAADRHATATARSTSATPTRTDGLSDALEAARGPALPRRRGRRRGTIDYQRDRLGQRPELHRRARSDGVDDALAADRHRRRRHAGSTARPRLRRRRHPATRSKSGADEATAGRLRTATASPDHLDTDSDATTGIRR